MIDESAALKAERASFLATMEELEPDQWDADSLAEGWRVRDVVAHINFNLTLGLGTSVLGVLKHRGNVDAFMATHSRKVGGEQTVAQHLGALRKVAASDTIPPTTKPSDGAIDVFVHHHDVALALGREVPSDDARLRWMADGVPQANRFIGSAPKVQGLRLIATDIDWHYGTGPEVRGPAAALIVASCGRSFMDDQLEGAGLATLQGRR